MGGERYLPQGETVFGYFNGPGKRLYANLWLDPALLNRGVYDPHSLCLPEFSIDCSDFVVLLATVSPDGSKILAYFHDFENEAASYWYLLEVRTKKITRLGTPFKSNEVIEEPCRWAPDETSVACVAQIRDEYDRYLQAIHVIPLSQEAGQFIATLPGDSSTFSWKILEWQP